MADQEKFDMDRLEFGPLFGDSSKVEPLTNAEVLELLEKIDETQKARGEEPTITFENAKTYVANVTHGMKGSTIKELRWTIRDRENSATLRRKLHPFEITALLNLTPEDIEQATALVPSLLSFDTPEEKEFIVGVVNEIRNRAPLQ